MAAAEVVIVEGGENDLIDRIASDEFFKTSKEEILKNLDGKNYIGLAPQQTEEFLDNIVKPILDDNKDAINLKVEINV